MPLQWAGLGEEQESRVGHPTGMRRGAGRPSCLGEPWELLEHGVAQHLICALLFCCLPISFVNDPLKIYLSLHVDNI